MDGKHCGRTAQTGRSQSGDREFDRAENPQRRIGPGSPGSGLGPLGRHGNQAYERA